MEGNIRNRWGCDGKHQLYTGRAFLRSTRISVKLQLNPLETVVQITFSRIRNDTCSDNIQYTRKGDTAPSLAQIYNDRGIYTAIINPRNKIIEETDPREIAWVARIHCPKGRESQQSRGASRAPGDLELEYRVCGSVR